MSYLLEAQRIDSGQQTRTGLDQVRNNVGGYVYAVDKWTQFERFLLLGTEGGTYYVKQQPLTRENTKNAQECLKEDSAKFLRILKDFSLSGRAPRQDQILYCLALAASDNRTFVRSAAFRSSHAICRTASHLYQFIAYADTMRRWGSGWRNMLHDWILDKDPGHLAYQVVKYQSRTFGKKTWSMRDVLRKIKPNDFKNPTTQSDKEYDAVLGWIARGSDKLAKVTAAHDPENGLDVILAAEQAKKLSEPDIALARQLPWEAVPDSWRKDPDVWAAMIPKLGATALIRNLATMTRVGLFNQQAGLDAVLDRLSDKDNLRKSRVHPVQVLAAWMTYRSGRSSRGDSTWTPNAEIVRALEYAFYFSFGNVEPANSRVHVGLDVSGSMAQGQLLDIPGLSPRVASAALSMIQFRTEPDLQINLFSDNYRRLDLKKYNADTRLEQYISSIADLPFQRTDCSLPMRVALQHKWPVDLFVIYTDSETWHGEVKPMDALRQYRQQMGINAKLITVAMTSTQFTIGDPNDPGTLDVVGFDLNVPSLIAAFGRPNAKVAGVSRFEDEEDI